MLDITKITPEKILDIMRKGNDFNIQTPNGYIYLVGGIQKGILSKLENGKHYITVGNKWIKI